MLSMDKILRSIKTKYTQLGHDTRKKYNILNSSTLWHYEECQTDEAVKVVITQQE